MQTGNLKRHKSSIACKRPSILPNQVVHHFDKYISLLEDTFGTLFDGTGKAVLVKRFTWTNHNKITVSVITYGARIISIKLPDRAANIEEIVLGHDDLPGYLFYDRYAFGAMTGRTTNNIQQATFVIENKQYNVHKNFGEHHSQGGLIGFDKVNWTPYVHGKVLQLSYVSRDGEEGYPGDLHVRITFELTNQAEFRINISANTSLTTPIEICNNTYFNLAGHNAGEAELRKHELLINSNCYTEMDHLNDFPTGKIFNVVHTRFDFQVPKLLGDVMKPGPDADFDQTFCMNRGVDQQHGFMARVVHPYKGRVLEIYSNQPGLHFTNCCEFPEGRMQIPLDMLAIKPSMTSDDFYEHENVFIVIRKVTEYFKEHMNAEDEEYHTFIKKLMKKLLSDKVENESLMSLTSELELLDTYSYTANQDFNPGMLLKPLEVQFLFAIRELLPYVTEDMTFDVVKAALDEILQHQQDPDLSVSPAKSNSFIKNLVYMQAQKMQNKMSEHVVRVDPESAVPVIIASDSQKLQEKPKSVIRQIREAKELRDKRMMKCGIPIPVHYKHNRITGRGGAIYKRYAGMSLRSQYYPNFMQVPHFPKSILRPQQTYSHSITYKFWIMAGNPARWLHRLKLSGPCDPDYY